MAEETELDEMVGLYLYENRELIENLQDLVLSQKDAPAFDADTIQEIFRTMHTIKGSAGLMMYDETARLAHKMEDVFYYIRESKPARIDQGKTVEYVLAVCDFISDDMKRIEEGEAQAADPSGLIAQIDGFLEQTKAQNQGESVPAKDSSGAMQFYVAPAKETGPAQNYFKVVVYFDEGLPMVNMHAYKLVRSLGGIFGEIIFHPENIVSDESTAEVILREGFQILLETKMNEQAVKDAIAVGYDVKKTEVTRISKLEYGKGFNQMDAFSGQQKTEYVPGDFVITNKTYNPAAHMEQAMEARDLKGSYVPVDAATMDEIMSVMKEVTALMGRLQGLVWSMNMVPLTRTFRMMNRIVFDASRKLKKSVELEMIGEDTVLDKNTIEHITDPLIHLVRNAVDHGIETPEERARTTKSEKAKITLMAGKENGWVRISVADDGKGLDRVKILRKAREKGLADAARADEDYTDQEVYEMILSPGFSTKETITEYSGRGVGMDVVVSRIKEIGGALEIDSSAGYGTTMCMRLPVTEG